MKIWYALFLNITFSLILKAQEANYEVAAKSIESDLKVELQALAELREEIAKERPELAQETAEYLGTKSLKHVESNYK